jgi:hypothetical protein
MEEFYIKNSNGGYVPVSFKKIITKDWENQLVAVRIGSDENPADDSEVEQTLGAINDADALDSLENTSFLVTLHNLEFEVIGNLREVAEKNIIVKITGGDDLSKLGILQKEARKQLRGKTKKVVFLPTPLTVNDYKEVMEIKRRCDTRKSRRGR